MEHAFATGRVAFQEAMTSTRGAILVFGRRPALGDVKTRLEAIIGERLTLEIYRAFLNDTLRAARESGARVLLGHTPGPPFPEQLLADDVFVQHGNTFAKRFDDALLQAAESLPRGTPLVLIGADTPHLSPRFLRQTLETLTDKAAVVGPNVNGGFYLLGFATHPVQVGQVFTHSASEEVDELLRILGKAGLTPRLLESNFDVDLPEDLLNLERLIDELDATSADWVPANTRAVLLSAPEFSLLATSAIRARHLVGLRKGWGEHN
jgi:glycosyltransferase A (GT-A) superfamily protein (DUF2064 family)